MCFSASASFTTTALLAVTGAALLHKGIERRYLALALMPFFFGLQEAFEGIIWLYEGEAPFSIQAFSFFALCFWPAYISFSMWMCEESIKEKIDIGCIGIGIGLCAYYFSILPFVQVEDCQYTIRYITPESIPLATQYTMGTLYMIPSLLPLWIASLKGLRYLGLVLFVTALLAFWVDQVWFISLWCFIAAVISISLFFIIPKKRGFFDWGRKE